MKRWQVVALVAVIVIAAAFLFLRSGPERVSLVFVNASVYTLEDSRPRAEAVAIRGDLIVGVGTSEDLLSRYTPDSVIDLGGKPVYPGFVDAHAHLEGIGVSLLTLDLNGKSLEEIRKMVSEAARTQPPDQWIRGRGWDQNQWPGKKFPERSHLDDVSAGHPVYLVRTDGHAVWVNTKVIEMARMTASTADPQGGRILREKGGYSSGVFIDNATESLGALLPQPTRDDRIDALRRAISLCLSNGITQVHDMGCDLERIEIYKELAREGKLDCRVYAVLEGTDRKSVEEYLTKGREIGLFGGKLTVRAIKLYADGALGSRGAALIEPYSDDPGNRGLTITDAPELEAATRLAAERGFQICVHAIGDRANHIVLSTFDKVSNSLRDQMLDLRFRVEHAQVLDPADIGEFNRIGVIPSMQPVHCTSDMPWAPDRLGPDRIKHAYAWKSLLQEGAHIAGGTDAPVEEPNIIKGFYAAITRQQEDGTPGEGWNAAERMEREEALKCFTAWASHAAYEDSVKGTISPGKWADLVVMSDDLMTADIRKITTIRVEKTVVAGKIVFDRTGEGQP